MATVINNWKGGIVCTNLKRTWKCGREQHGIKFQEIWPRWSQRHEDFLVGY